MTQTAKLTTPETALRAARETAVLAHRPAPGVLRVSGEDALDLINRLSTNEVEEMPVGSGLSTVLTTNKGRVVDLLTILYLSEHWLLLTSPGTQQKVIDWIEEFTFGEEIEVEDVTAETAVLTIVGPRAPDIMHTLTQADFSAMPTHNSVQTTISATEVLVSKADPALGDTFTLLVPIASAPAIHAEILAAGEVFGMREMDADSYEAFRIAAGVPAHGPEFGEEVNPLEAGLWDAVSFTKGCYVGQEVVARLNTYEKVKRYLAMLSLQDGPIPDAGTALTVDGKDAGKLTSVSPILISGRRPAIGYVRKAYARPDVSLTVESGDGPVACEFIGRIGTRGEG
jgi:folate-binding protein YgfZ